MDCIFSYLLLSESASCVRHCAQRARRLKKEWCWSLIWRNSPSQYIWSDDSKHKWVWVVSTLSEVVGFYVLWLGFWCRIHTYMWYILTHNWNQSIERNKLAKMIQSSIIQRPKKIFSPTRHPKIKLCMQGTAIRKVPSTRWGSKVRVDINIHGRTWLCIILLLGCVENVSKLTFRWFLLIFGFRSFWFYVSKFRYREI